MHLTRHRLFFHALNDPVPSPCCNIVSAIEQIASFHTAGFRITKPINMAVPTGNLLAGISASRDHNLSARTEFNRHEIKRRMRRSSVDTPHSFAQVFISRMKLCPIKVSFLYCFFANERTWFRIPGLILKNISLQ